MAEAEHPKISIIMPTLNAGALLDNCLASVAAQTYPRDRLEIILADAFSKDATRDIAKKYGARVIDDTGKNMEEGKRLALTHATGDYIVFVDADNEFTHPDFLALAVRALEKNPQALGVESYYLPSAKMSSFCAYVTHRLHISDPICWLMSANPIAVARDERFRFSPRRFGIGEGQRTFSGHARRPAPDEGRQTRVAPLARSRRASLLRADVVGLFAKAAPRHRPFSPGTGGDARELDEGKAARADLGRGTLLLQSRWAGVSHAAGTLPRRRSALALAHAHERREPGGSLLGNLDLQDEQAKQATRRRFAGETNAEAETAGIWIAK
jgi:hypothetical protein